MRIAITGHRGLPADTEHLVDQAIRNQLAESVTDDHLIGVSILADGADQIFARAVLDLGGQLEVVVPATRYRDWPARICPCCLRRPAVGRFYGGPPQL